MKRFLFTITALLISGCGGLEDGLENDPERTSYHNVECGKMPTGKGLNRGQSITSCDKRFRLSMQKDGNLVVYRLRDRKALWSTKTVHSGNRVIMQKDGNLVVYDHWNRGVWSSRTNGNAGAYLTVQSDGNVVIRKKRALWSTGTVVAVPIPKCGVLVPGRVMRKGIASSFSARSCDRRLRLMIDSHGRLMLEHGPVLWQISAQGDRAVMQKDGNLVVYAGSRAVWHTHTHGNPGSFLKIQNDGNLVLLSETGRKLWASGSKAAVKIPECGTLKGGQGVATVTSCKGGFRLVMQRDGNLVLYTAENKAYWSSSTQYKGKRAIMQKDGNFVIYDNWNRAVWHTNTHGNAGAFLQVKNDGTLVINDKYGRALWPKR